MRALVAAEAMDGADELRKATQVAARFEMAAAHRRREAQHLRCLATAEPGDEAVEAAHHRLELA